MIRLCCKSIFNFLIISIFIIVFCANSFADRNIGVERARSCDASGRVSPFEEMLLDRGEVENPIDHLKRLSSDVLY